MDVRRPHGKRIGLLFSFLLVWLVFETLLIAMPAAPSAVLVKQVSVVALLVFAVYSLWCNRGVISSAYAEIKAGPSDGKTLDGVALSLFVLTFFCSVFVLYQAQNTGLVFGKGKHDATTESHAILVLPFETSTDVEREQLLIDGLYNDFVEDVSARMSAHIIAPTRPDWNADIDDHCALSQAVFRATHVLSAHVNFNDGLVEFDADIMDCTGGRQPLHERVAVPATPLGLAGAKDNIIRSVSAYVSPSVKLADADSAGGESAEAFERYLEAIGMYRGVEVFQERFTRRDVIARLEEAVELDPDLDIAWARLAQTYAEYAWYEADHKSFKESERIIGVLRDRLGPRHYLVDRAEGLFNLYQRRLSVAEGHLRRANKARPNDMLTNYMLGQVLMLSGRPREAVPYYEKVLSVDPYYTVASIRLMSINLQLGRFTAFEQAARALERAVDGAVFYKVGLIYYYDAQIGADQEMARRFFEEKQLIDSQFAQYFPWLLTTNKGNEGAFYERLIAGAQQRLQEAEERDVETAGAAEAVRQLVLSYSIYLRRIGDSEKLNVILREFVPIPILDEPVVPMSRTTLLLEAQNALFFALTDDSQAYRSQLEAVENNADDYEDRMAAGVTYISLALAGVIAQDKENVLRLLEKSLETNNDINAVTVLRRLPEFDLFLDDPRFQKLIDANNKHRNGGEAVFKTLMGEDYVSPATSI